MQIEQFQIDERFCGPPRSGNGGYTCGRVARHLEGTPAIRLKVPPPINTALRLEYTDQDACLFHGATLVAEGRPCNLELEAPTAPSWEEALEASRSYVGFQTHSFPGCFVCGPSRKAGDGLRIFPGLVRGRPVLAAPWVPDASLAEDGIVKPEFLWSALDCTGAFAVLPAGEDTAIVLGELCAELRGTVAPDEPCVVTGWSLGVAGRKRLAGSAVYAADGRVIALARAVWIEVPAHEWT